MLFGFDHKVRQGDDIFDGLTVRVKILTEVRGLAANGYKRVVSHSEENLLPEHFFTSGTSASISALLTLLHKIIWAEIQIIGWQLVVRRH